MNTGVATILTKPPRFIFYFSSFEQNDESGEAEFKTKPLRHSALYLTAVT